MGIIQFILQCMYFMLPAYVANMVPVFFRGRLKVLELPLDFGRSFAGRRILGDHKTLRGLIVGVVFAVVVAYLQYLIKNTAVFYYMTMPALDYGNWFWLGILFGAGVIFGDALESFFKRRAGIAPGRHWVPFDQIDFVLGALLFVSIVYVPRWYAMLAIVIVSFLLHFATNHTAYYLRIRKEKW